MKSTHVFVAICLLSTISSCKKSDSKNISIKKTVDIQKDKFAVDSLLVGDSLKINDLLTIRYESKMLVFPTIKEKALLDSIYYQTKGVTDFSKQGLQKYLEDNKNEYFSSVKNQDNSWIADINRPQTWESVSSMKLKSNQNDFLQIEYLYSSYEGGAHGNYGFSERVFDVKNSKKLNLSDITTMPKAMLEAILLKNIDKMPSGTTDSQGAVKNSDMLLLQTIPANNNFYFDDKNLYFHYSPYEIAAFAAGDIVIPVSWDELEGTLTPSFKERMKIK